MTCLGRHGEAKKNVVMLVAGIAQLEKVVGDPRSIAQAFEQVPLEEGLGCSLACSAGRLMPGCPAIKGQCAQEDNRFGTGT